MPGRKRRTEPADEESSPEPQTQRRRVSSQASDDEEPTEDDYGVSTQTSSLDDMAKKMVRLALACEYQRKPIRKADISEKVLGAHSRQFKAVFNAAQVQLRHVFGMEMVELPAKEKVTVQQRRAAQKTSSQSKPIPSWILTSTLPPAFRTPDILQPPSAPGPAEESEYTGIYTLLVVYISLSGGSISDAKMSRVLKRLHIDESTPVREHKQTEKLLSKLHKDGYIVKNKDSSGTGEDDITWTVGPRGKVEIGDQGVKGLTKAVFGDMDTEAEELELEKKIQRSLGIVERPGEAAAENSDAPRRRRGRRERDAEQQKDDNGVADDGQSEDDDDDNESD